MVDVVDRFVDPNCWWIHWVSWCGIYLVDCLLDLLIGLLDSLWFWFAFDLSWFDFVWLCWLVGLIDCLVDWFIDCLIDLLSRLDRSIGWVVDWLAWLGGLFGLVWLGGSFGWFVELIDWSVDCLVTVIGCLIGWLIEWLIDWLIDLIGCLTWFDWLVDWLSEWWVDCLIGWFYWLDLCDWFDWFGWLVWFELTDLFFPLIGFNSFDLISFYLICLGWFDWRAHSSIGWLVDWCFHFDVGGSLAWLVWLVGW